MKSVRETLRGLLEESRLRGDGYPVKFVVSQSDWEELHRETPVKRDVKQAVGDGDPHDIWPYIMIFGGIPVEWSHTARDPMLVVTTRE